MAKDINIGGRLHSIATGNVVAGTDEILDDNLGKKQTQINTETYSLVESVNNALAELSPDQQEALAVATKANANEAKLGYYVCDTDADVAAKTVAATNYVLGTGGSIKVKMTNDNTVNNARLNINSTGTKPLFYEGARASSTNTWAADDILEIYYDGTNYQARNISPTFKTGEKVNSVGVDDEPTAGSDNLVKSGGIYKTTPKISNTPVLKSAVLSDADFYLCDEQNNAILKLDNGHIFTKNFNSTFLRTLSSSSSSDFCLADENGNVILKLNNGHIFTKNFASNNIPTHVQGDFHNYHAIGDSITYGTAAQGHEYFTYFQELCGFSSVTDDGVGGREISNGVKSALSNIPIGTDCVSIFAGTNDWGHHLPLGTMEDTISSSTMFGALKYICEWMSTNKPTVGFFFITPIQRNCGIWPADNEPVGSWVNSLGLRLDDYVDAIKEVSSFYGIPCLDLFTTCFNGHSDTISTTYMLDGLHPNVAGHRILARKISKFINFKF